MSDIFGLSMTTILMVVVSIMAACLATTAVIGLRNRVIFKMALRNIPRRRAQTILIMVGLMLSTLIIAAALTTGDTLDHSITASTYDSLGEVDETLAYVGETDSEGVVSVNNVPIDAALADRLEAELADNPDIDGVMPVLTVSAPAVNDAAGRSEPQVVVTGLDAARLPDFGELRTAGGEEIDFAGLPAGSAVISDDLAAALDAGTGDRITIYYEGQPQELTVGAVADGSILTGYQQQMANAGPASIGEVELLGVAVPLDWLQSLTGLEGQARFIAVSNAGGVEDGAERTDAAVEALETALANVEGGEQIGINPLKQDAVEGAETFGATFTTLFLVMGLFSIAAGVLLIFMIFMMLAAERRSEMGMARAVGMTRSHLAQGFITEGTAYDLGAALIGAAAGVLVAFGIATVLDRTLGDTLSITPYATWRSLAVAYALGVSVTFLTIIFASVRSSRLNIVAAIRDLPEQDAEERGVRPRWSWWRQVAAGAPLLARLPLELLWNVVLIPLKFLVFAFKLQAHYLGWGPSITVVGLAFALLGTAATNMFSFSLGLSLAVLGLMLLLRAWLPTRLVYTSGAGLMLLYWLLPPDVTNTVLPDVGDGGPEMLVVSGIFMVLYSTLIIMWNADLIVGFVSLLGRSFSSWLPAVKMAVAYPLSSKGRAGMTIAMFSIVVFALVMVATISTNFRELLLTEDAAAGWDIEVTANASNPIDDLGQSLAGTSVNADAINAIGRVDGISEPNSLVRNPGDDAWGRYPINGADQSYIDNAVVELQARAEGYESDEAVWQAISSGHPVAVIDYRAFESDEFGGGDSERYVAPDEIDIGGDTFQPFEIELQSARSGRTETITVIGVIDSSISTLRGIYLPQAVFADIYGTPDISRFYVQLNESAGVDEAEFAADIQGALRTSGVRAESIMEQIEEQQAFSSSFFTLMQGFMGLGLFVGLAALGVVSFRAVVERRQQIGMLRAIGYQRGMVAASFMLESLITATLGVLTGVGMALALSYNLIAGGNMGDEEFTTFVIPAPTIALVIVAALAAAALMTWIPARKAATVPVSEALRYE